MKLNQKSEIYRILFGLFVVSCIVFPYFILGENSYVQVHDQVDGEILNYIYQAKYLFQGNIIHEFMNGASKASMLPPAPFGVLFYKLLPPFWAFVVMQWFILIVGFVGMYFLLRRLQIVGVLAMVISILFCYNPFYPVYGLAALGQPVVILAGLLLLEEKKKILPFLMLILYGGFSSLTLTGYAWVLFGYLFSIILFLLHRKKQGLCIAQGTTVLTMVYLLTNVDLFKDFFGNNGFVTHRTEMVLKAEDLWDKFKSLLLIGGSYSNVYSCAILGAVVVTSLLGVVLYKIKKDDRQVFTTAYFMMVFLAVIFIVLALLAAMWTCTPIVKIRNIAGGFFVYFQADRIYWFFPFLCVLILAYTIQTWLEWSKQGESQMKKLALTVCMCSLLIIQGYQEFRDGTLNKNIRLLFVDGYEQVTWKSIYMDDVFEEIASYIYEDKKSYSVVSLGIYPSVTLYHGFICADGYSNNYDVEYKHQFLEILEKELEKNEAVRSYLQDWGNRLYFVSAEYGVSAMLGKDSNVVFHDVSWNMEAMSDLNVRYIFSSGEILNADKLGLELVRKAPFESDTSYYRIWLYEIR